MAVRPAVVAAAAAGVAALAGVGLVVTTTDDKPAPPPVDVFLTPADSIQKTLDTAQPGTTVHLAAGRYAQSFRSRVDGSADKPVRVTGPREAVVTGKPGNTLCGSACVVLVEHDFTLLEGFTIDGGGAANQAQLVLIRGRGGWENDQPNEGVDGAQVRDMRIGGARNSCVIVRWWAEDVQVADNTVGPCGLAPNDNVGEGIYIGTDGGSLLRVGTNAFDHSRRNVVARNRVDVAGGSECVEIKPMANDNVVADNDCAGTADGGAGIRVKGSRNMVTGNHVHDLRDTNGAAFAFDGGPYDNFDKGRVGLVTVGVGNVLTGNMVGPGVKVGVTARVGQQGLVCGNRMPAVAALNVGVLVGNPTSACPTPPPPVTTTTTTEPVFYANCDAVRAAGAAPLSRDDAGYRSRLDGDKDGVACE